MPVSRWVQYLIIILTITGTNPPVFSQDSNFPNYREIYGSDYQYAINLLDRNDWWVDTLEKHGLDPDFALAVIFPELIRYSSIVDYVQIKGLEVLYVQYGQEYADFSVGYFQMKPSFAEKVEADLLKLGIIKTFPVLSELQPELPDNPETRKNRILRLKDEYFQLLYLEAFLRIMESIFIVEVADLTLAEKLGLFSTAYNTGYFKGISTISEEMRKKRFFCGFDLNTEKRSYSDISCDFFSNQKNKSNY